MCKIIGRLLYRGKSYGVTRKAGLKPAFLAVILTD